MDSYFSQIITLGLLFVLLLLLFRSYWTFKKKVAGFPFYNLLPYVLYCQISGKISKDTPLNNVLFEELVKLGKRHFKEGLFMTYGSQPSLFIFSEDAIKAFANEKAALDKSTEYKILEQVIGAGIMTSNGERWRRHRKLINPAFNMGVLKEKVSLFNEHAMALVKDVDNLVDEMCADILDVVKFHYFNALSESVLGMKQGEEPTAELLKLSGYVDKQDLISDMKKNKRVWNIDPPGPLTPFLWGNWTHEERKINLSAMTVKRILYPWLRPKFLLNFFPSGRKFLQENNECGKFINETALNMKKHIFSATNEDVSHFGNHLRKSFTYLLLKYHSNNPRAFTFEDLLHETRTIMVSGYDSVTYTTMWCLFLLGLHPEIQEKVYAEIQSTTSDYITYEESGNLTYLEAVLMETLRLYPTAPIFSRYLSEDIQYGKYKIHKGTSIAFFPYISHRDPKVYPDPEKFEPERFLNPETRKTWSFIPFSEGSRSCIGKNYALIEMKIFLAHILRNFKFASLDRREDIKLCWTIILSPTKHLRFKITKR